MNTLEAVEEPAGPVETESPPEKSARPSALPVGCESRLPMRYWLAMPLAFVCALIVHWAASRNELPPETFLYFQLLGAGLAAALFAAVGQRFFTGLRDWMRETGPIVAVVVLFLCAWEVATSGFRW